LKTNKYFLIDFDSTFIKTEGLDELAKLVLKGKKNAREIETQISELTKQGMEGKLDFRASLEQRLKLLRISKREIEALVKVLKKKVSSSVRRNKSFFKTHAKNIYIISGGFKEYVWPVVSSFGIKEANVFANSFEFFKNGLVTGFDKANPLSQSGGKVKVVRGLKLKGDLIAIGDGYSDYELKQMKVAKQFVAFTENIVRTKVTQKADVVAPSFDEFLYVNKLPASYSYPKNRIKVLLLENISSLAKELLTKEGYEVTTAKRALTEAELMERIRDVQILGVRSKTKVTAKVLAKANRLLAIGAFCIGTDQTDLAAAAQKGITLFNAPFQNTRSVVELAVMAIIALFRKSFEKSTLLHRGVWDKNAQNCFEVRGKTLGIVGYGNIGSQLGEVAQALGMNVLYYNRSAKLSRGNARPTKTLAELLKKSDVVSVHVSGDKANSNLFGKKEFALMKRGALFINMSRGFVVNIYDLVEALKSKKLAGAALDVFPEEPKAKTDPFVSALQNLPNVILTPHVGAGTEEAQTNIARYVSEKILQFVNSGDSKGSVTLPQISVAKQPKGVYRLLHVHQNVPGVLAQINAVMAKSGVNIINQSLATGGEVGYVITDINKHFGKHLLGNLKKIKETIRFRILY